MFYFKKINWSICFSCVCSVVYVYVVYVVLNQDQISNLKLLFMALVNLLIHFLVFSISHEGVHYNISKNRFWNDFFMAPAAIISFIEPWNFRRSHFFHHKYLGDKDLDPEYPLYTKKPDMKSLIDAFMHRSRSYGHYMRTEKERYWRIRANIFIALCLFIIVFSAFHENAVNIFCVVWLPLFISGPMISFMFTTLLHPLDADGRLQTVNRKNFLFSVVLLRQNLHLLHHNKPYLRWYKYQVLDNDNK